MLQEEFNRLMKIFQEAAEGKQVDIEGLFKQSLQFFEHLRERMAKGTPEEKAQAVQLMTQMYQQMMAQTKAIAEKSGMTEEQLAAFARNPENFTKEQWDSFQSSKEKMEHIGEDIAKQVERSSKKDGDKPSQGKRDSWLKS